jgi:flagellar export protein FliJ
MGAFKFRLEPVVNLKKRAEDIRKTELAEARMDLGRKETRLVNLFEHREACQAGLTPGLECSSLDVPGKLVYYAYMERLTDEIAEQASVVKDSREDVASKRELLLESSREKKALEKLKERMKQRFTEGAKRAEQACLDDTAGKLHMRNGDGKLKWKKE